MPGECKGMTLPEHPTVETIEQLVELVADLQQQNATLQQRVAELEAENERLRHGLGGPPASSAATAKPPRLSDLPHFVKPNKRAKEKGEGNQAKPDKKRRRQRDRGYARPVQPPTRVEPHYVEQCPDCGRKLQGGWLHAEREVIDIPAAVLQLVEVVRHQLMARRCGACGKRHVPKVADTQIAARTVGKHRFGVRLMSLVAHLVHVCRMPVRTVRKLLASLVGVQVSCGGIVEMLHSVARQGQRTYEHLREELRASAYAHGDETNWREDGINGYLWSFSTPTLRLFVRSASRAHTIPEEVLGSSWRGILISDFYSGYHYHLGPHQRCWVHLLRDAKALSEAYPQDQEVQRWIRQLHDLYTEANATCYLHPKDRVRARETFQRRLVALATPWARGPAPQAGLAERLLRFEPELFTFVEHPFVPSDNNAAERAIRPAVIARKISGGTRSKKGSDTRAVLMSLFATWQARGLDPLQACAQMLMGQA